MNFFELLQQIQEARFEPIAGSELKKISLEELGKLTFDLMKKACGETSVQSIPGFRGIEGAQLNVGTRHFDMYTDGISKCDSVKSHQLPRLYISFNWDEKTRENPEESGEKFSDKEGSAKYPVRQEIQKDTIESIHKIRDGVIRPLSNYAICIFYIGIGSRRQSLYSSVLSGSGFKEVRGCAENWVPASLPFDPPTTRLS